MGNKYYTPELSEFFVGFEYEVMIANEDYDGHGWMKLTYPKDPLIGESISRKSNMKDIRVKYLDKQDLEDCGFELRHICELKKEDYGFYKGEFSGVIWNSSGKMSISDSTGFDIYKGNIPKNINEFKKLLKQLGV